MCTCTEHSDCEVLGCLSYVDMSLHGFGCNQECDCHCYGPRFPSCLFVTTTCMIPAHTCKHIHVSTAVIVSFCITHVSVAVHLHVRGLCVREIIIICVDLCLCICGKDLSPLYVLHVCGPVTVVCDWRHLSLSSGTSWSTE